MLNRRERARAATVDEIKSTSRRLLAEQGPASLTLRAIAREMGMTAPALYRYFPSHDELVTAVVADVYHELADALEASVADLPDAEQAALRLFTLARAFRRWAVENPHPFSLVFATPVPAGGESAPGSGVSAVAQAKADRDSPVFEAGARFGGVFVEAFFSLWQHRPFRIPAEDELPPSLLEQLAAYRARLVEQGNYPVSDVPLGAFELFLQGWVRLYGLVALEVFDHLTFCLADPEPAFEAHLRSLCADLGITDADLANA